MTLTLLLNATTILSPSATLLLWLCSAAAAWLIASELPPLRARFMMAIATSLSFATMGVAFITLWPCSEDLPWYLYYGTSCWLFN